MGVYKRGNRWWIEYQREGTRYRESAGRTKRVAEQALAVRRAEVAQGKFQIEATRRSPRVEVFVEEYLAWARLHHRTAENTEASRLRILLPFFRGRRLRDLTPALIEQYKAQRAREVKPATVNRELEVLSSLLSRAVTSGQLTVHPMKGGKVRHLPQHNLVERILTDKEEMRLLKVAPPELQDVLVVALDTGMRLGELTSLTPADVDLARAEVRLRHTKNGKERRLPLTPRAVAVFTARCYGLTPEAPLFPSRPGQRPWRLDSAFGRACARAGVTGLRFHDLRHTFASRLVTGGVDLVTVQHLLGHGDLRMTSRYAHPTGASIRQALAVLAQQQGVPTKVPTIGELVNDAIMVTTGF